MVKRESPLSGLAAYIPVGSLSAVISYLQEYKVHLTITRERKTILGNYRGKFLDKHHRITVNGNLNRYSFLITLLHELAHLLAFEKYGPGIPPHGAQWKREYGQILEKFLGQKIFPPDIGEALLRNLQNQAAGSCADIHLTRVLRKYDDKKDASLFIEEIVEGGLFKIKDGKIFRKGQRVKKRFKCMEMATGKMYLFSPVYEVHPA